MEEQAGELVKVHVPDTPQPDWQVLEEQRKRAGWQPSGQETAEQLAQALLVTDSLERLQIYKVVRALGRTQARALCEEACGSAISTSSDQAQATRYEKFLHLAQSKGKLKERLEPEQKQVASRIAEALDERGIIPLWQILQIVSILGEEKALSYLSKVEQIEASGGMMTADGSRRRTKGGVYFFLVRKQSQGGTRAKLFPLPTFATNKQASGLPKGEEKSRVLSPLHWGERGSAILEAEKQKGQATTMKITIIGRPGRVVVRNGCVTTIVTATRIPALPKGLPVPPHSSTQYALYISSKQWTKVAEAIRDEEDTLIVEGWPHLDQESKQIAVYATSVTTKKIQQAVREKQSQTAK